MRIVSIDLHSDFGFFRKPETNGTINLSYNMIHKPAVLGILGAIIGLDGYKEKGVIPEYYKLLGNLKIAIEPLAHDKGVYVKTAIKYTNTVGYANKGANYLTEELTLIKPAYRVYLMLDMEDVNQVKLLNYLQEALCDYIPYFGKNEFTAWWCKDSFNEYDFEVAHLESDQGVIIRSLFLKSFVLKDYKGTPFVDMFSFDDSQGQDMPYTYFERLPLGFNEDLMQYDLYDFAYTTSPVKNANVLDSLYLLKNENSYVQFF